VDQFNDLVAPAVLGCTAGFVGGTVAALVREPTWRQTGAAVLGGAGLGGFIAPSLVEWLGAPLGVAGAIGFLGGLGVFGFVAGIQRLSSRFGENPEAILPESIRSRLPPGTGLHPPLADDRPAGSKPHVPLPDPKAPPQSPETGKDRDPPTGG
jgi:hypothetical protein